MNTPQGSTGSKDEPAGSSFPPLLLFAGALLIGVLLEWLCPFWWMPHNPIIVIAGGCLSFGAIVLNSWCAYEFGRHQTHFDPHRCTSHFVRTGPYQYSRHPMYLGLCLLLVGLGLTAGSGWILLLTIPTVIVLHWFVIVPEEEALHEQFGDDYRTYCVQVGRWFSIP